MFLVYGIYYCLPVTVFTIIPPLTAVYFSNCTLSGAMFLFVACGVSAAPPRISQLNNLLSRTFFPWLIIDVAMLGLF